MAVSLQAGTLCDFYAVAVCQVVATMATMRDIFPKDE